MLDDDINRRTTNTTPFAPKQAGQIAPAFQFSILTCKPSLLATKIIYPIGEPRPYDNAKQFLFAYKEVDCLEDFAKIVLPYLAKESRRFIIRGQLKPGLAGWQFRHFKRDPITIECPPRRWIVLDIDGARVPAGLGAPASLPKLPMTFVIKCCPRISGECAASLLRLPALVAKDFVLHICVCSLC